MNTLGIWLPGQEPPQLNPEATEAILVDVLEKGIDTFTSEGRDEIERHHIALAEYLDLLSNSLVAVTEGEKWPDRMLRIGAATAILGYQKAGIDSEIDDQAIERGTMFAEFEGVPDAYVSCLYLDARLAELRSTLLTIPDLQNPELDEPYSRVMDIGAGCTRFFLQQAIAA